MQKIAKLNLSDRSSEGRQPYGRQLGATQCHIKAAAKGRRRPLKPFALIGFSDVIDRRRDVNSLWYYLLILPLCKNHDLGPGVTILANHLSVLHDMKAA